MTCNESFGLRCYPTLWNYKLRSSQSQQNFRASSTIVSKCTVWSIYICVCVHVQDSSSLCVLRQMISFLRETQEIRQLCFLHLPSQRNQVLDSVWDRVPVWIPEHGHCPGSGIWYKISLGMERVPIFKFFLHTLSNNAWVPNMEENPWMERALMFQLLRYSLHQSMHNCENQCLPWW